MVDIGWCTILQYTLILEMVTIMDSLVHIADQEEAFLDLQVPTSNYWSCHVPCHTAKLRLGKYLKHCRVKVIDRDTFPSSYYAEQIATDVEEVSQTGLFVEYVKLVLEQPGNTWRFLVTALFDLMKNIYVWFTLKASVYMVNVVFGHGDNTADELLVRDDPERTAQVIGLL